MASLVVPWDWKTGRVPAFTYETFTKLMCRWRKHDNLRYRRTYWYVNSLSTNLRVRSQTKMMLNKWRFEHAEEVPELYSRAKRKHAKEEAALSVDAHQLATELMITNDVGRPKTAREARQELHMDKLKATFEKLYNIKTKRGIPPYSIPQFHTWSKKFHEHWADTTAADLKKEKPKLRIKSQSNAAQQQTPQTIIKNLIKEYTLDSTQQEFLTFVIECSTKPKPKQFLVLLHGPPSVFFMYFL